MGNRRSESLCIEDTGMDVYVLAWNIQFLYNLFFYWYSEMTFILLLSSEFTLLASHFLLPPLCQNVSWKTSCNYPCDRISIGVIKKGRHHVSLSTLLCVPHIRTHQTSFLMTGRLSFGLIQHWVQTTHWGPCFLVQILLWSSVSCKSSASPLT